jgi:membrane peptidoglycan carboxypeptidase
MVDTHAITREQAEKAKASPLKLAPPNVEASDAPYFVDMVRDTLINKFSEHDLNDESYRIYTTLDPDLQKPRRRPSRWNQAGRRSSHEDAHQAREGRQESRDHRGCPDRKLR